MKNRIRNVNGIIRSMARTKIDMNIDFFSSVYKQGVPPFRVKDKEIVYTTIQ